MSLIHRAATVAAIAVVFAIYQSAGTADTGPRFEIDAKWPKDLPGDWITGRLGGVCMDAKGDNVYVVNRADITEEEKETSTSAPSIIKFNAAGDVVASWGNQKTVPGSIHGCFVDLAGNVWVAGNGDAMIQKYDPAGKLLHADRPALQVRLGRRHAQGRRQEFGAGPAPHAGGGGDRSRQWRYLRRRRLRQPPRRGVRQGRQVPAPVGPAGDRRGDAEGGAWRVRPGRALHPHEQHRPDLRLRPAGQPRAGVPQGRHLRAQHPDPEQIRQAAGQARHRLVGGVLARQGAALSCTS